jgi:hypothetical protein
MTRIAIRRSMTTAIAALLLAVGAAVSVAPAHADEKDDKFIEFLEQKGVPYANKTEIIRVAKDFCLQRTRQNAPKWRGSFPCRRGRSLLLFRYRRFALGPRGRK